MQESNPKRRRQRKQQRKLAKKKRATRKVKRLRILSRKMLIPNGMRRLTVMTLMERNMKMKSSSANGELEKNHSAHGQPFLIF